MKNRAPDRNKIASELDVLNEQLAEVRAESRRLAASRIATERKLEHIGKNLSDLKTQLVETVLAQPKPKR